MNDSSLINHVSQESAVAPRPTKPKLTKRAEERLAALPVHEGNFANRWSATHGALAEALTEARDAKATLQTNVKRYANYNMAVPAEVKASDEAAVETNRRIADRAQEDLTAATRLMSDMRASRQGVDAFVRGLSESILDVEPEGVPSGLSPTEGIAGEVALQRTIGAEIKRVKAARLGPEADLAAFEATLDKRASAPDFEVVESGGVFVARFPITATGGESRGRDFPAAPDYLPWFIHEHKKKRILPEAKKVIDEFYVYANVLVLTDAEKRKRLAALAKDLLASQRREAHFVWEALAHGESVAFRPSLSPVAILGTTGTYVRPRPKL